jgi:ADP-ribose pyrophosphatase YjhB (NUDIX family)
MPQKIALGVKGIIMDWQNFLVLEKSKTLFDLPGGRLRIDENSEEGLLREINEEVDISVQILGPFGILVF